MEQFDTQFQQIDVLPMVKKTLLGILLLTRKDIP